MTLPNSDTIVNHAVELWKQDRIRNGQPYEINPEISELQEEGFIIASQQDLMRNNDEYKQWLNKELSDKNHQIKSMDYKSLIEKVSGDLVILGAKDTCKTTLLKHLARELSKDARNTVVIMETFPKLIFELDNNFGYFIIANSDVQEYETSMQLDMGYSYIQWAYNYHLVCAKQLEQVLKTERNLIILVECEDMEKISFVMTQIIYYYYRKQYQRAKQNCLHTINEQIWFLVEEAHNILDSTVIAKKVFNKLRKIQNEFRNLDMHMICVALRLQDLNPRIRTKMSILLARVSLDDYQLKIRALLRNSVYRDEITNLEKGQFVFPQTDEIIETQPFQQINKPFEIQFIDTPKQSKPSLLKRIISKIMRRWRK